MFDCHTQGCGSEDGVATGIYCLEAKDAVNILQCTGMSKQTIYYRVQNVNNAKRSKPWVR